MTKEGYDPKCFHTCPDCDYRCNCGDIPCSHCLSLFIATEEDGSQWVKYEDFEKLMKYKKRWVRIKDFIYERINIANYTKGLPAMEHAIIVGFLEVSARIRDIEKEIKE
ncbi:hypothetical protein LCGC14_0794280 [marine sediment metagenome]|uniref:Uncharacterized protein n=1 Tax=marine sediment metagenome TaxID=412755 RepID=A0A0F9SBL5_9ZZZZ